MTKTLIVLAALAASQSALAETVTRDGNSYTYTVEQRGKATIITGRDDNTREPFKLRVVGRSVTGTVAGNWVSFSTPKAVLLRASVAPAEIAAR